MSNTHVPPAVAANAGSEDILTVCSLKSEADYVVINTHTAHLYEEWSVRLLMSCDICGHFRSPMMVMGCPTSLSGRT